MFQGIPRWIIVFGIILVVGFEVIARLPDILLIPERLSGQVGEYGSKALQPQAVTAGIDKTQAEAQLAATQAQLALTQAQLNAVQQQKVAAETRLADAQTTKTNLESTGNALALALTGALVAGGVKAYQALTDDSPHPEGHYATVTATNLNLRTGPAASYDVIVVMPQGQKVKVVSVADNGWLEVEFPAQGGGRYQGFANGKLLNVER